MISVDVLVDLRPRFKPVRDQLKRPTCLAFAMSDAHAATLGLTHLLSVEYLYYHAVQATSSRDPRKGVGLPPITVALTTQGQPHEQSWPYLAQLPRDLSTWKPPAGCGQIWSSPTTLQQEPVGSICASLNANVPVVVAMTITTSFHTPNDSLISSVGPGNTTGRHAVIAVGHGVFKAERLVLVRNSWGSGWGDSGHAWVAESYMQNRIIATATIDTHK